MGILKADVLTHSQLQPTGSVFFDGTNDKITTTGFGNIDTSDFTFECWVYLSTTSGTQRIMSADEGSQSTEYTQIRAHSTHGWQGYIGTDSGWWEAKSGNDHPTFTTGWHHVVLQRFGNDGYIFVDGEYVITSQDGSSAVNAADPVTVTTFVLGHGYGSEYLNAGYISNARITTTAVYGGSEFTPPKFELKPIDGTHLLCCQSSSDAEEVAVRINNTGSAHFTVAGAVASSLSPGLKKDVTDTGVVFDGFSTFATSTYMVPPSGKTTERNRGRALFGGGEAPSRNETIDFIEIQSGGIGQDFGDLTTGSNSTDAVSSKTRAVFTVWNSPAGYKNVLEYVTIATTGNSADFGDQTVETEQEGTASNDIYGVFAGGYNLAYFNQIERITLATLGNATDFGDLTTPTVGVGGAADTTRGIFAGGIVPGATRVNTIEYITFATTGDATDFGDLTNIRRNPAGTSDSTRGIFAGGSSPTYLNIIDFITIQTTGNATDFGDLITAADNATAASNNTRGIIGGHYLSSSPHLSNIIESVTIQTTGNAVDYGDLFLARSQLGACSDSHGGLS